MKPKLKRNTHTRLFTEAGSWYLNVEPLLRDNRCTPTEKDTKPTNY